MKESELLFEYFENKEAIKIAKYDRSVWWKENDSSCDHAHGVEGDYGEIFKPDCIEVKKDYMDDLVNPDSFKMCNHCKERNSFHDRIKVLSGRNSGIMNKLRGMVGAHKIKKAPKY